jgi:hypothetical protein
MNFGLLLSQLPHVQESRTHYDTMLALRSNPRRKFAVFWDVLKTLIS